MDYKYIEQLLERYWDGATSLEEETILRTFFSQQKIPASLAFYKDLFVYEQNQKQVTLGNNFDQRVLQAIETDYKNEGNNVNQVKAKQVTITQRLRPLYRAVAIVAVVTLVGISAQHTFTSSPNASNQSWDYNQSAYKDSYQDPTKAYEATKDILKIFKKGAQTAIADSSHKTIENIHTKVNVE